MLLAYKEEVDTLNEALKIAAMDIAEVAQADDALSDDLSDEEDSAIDGDGDGEGEFVDASASQFSKAGNKSAVMRAVMEDSGRMGGMGNVGGVGGVPATFLVHEDGTFEQK
jgi:hypothetical protein